MMVNFEYLELEGFGSIVNKLRYPLNSIGINVLQARNGIGKTTIFSGFHWVIYGKPLKLKSQVQTWPDKRGKNFKGTKGVVTWSKGNDKFKIIRYEKYQIEGKARSEVIFLINGEEVKDKGKKTIQVSIQEHLGFSSDLFKNSIIFGQKMKRIIEEDGPTKKKVFDEAFEIGYIQKAKDKSEADRSDLMAELKEVSLKLSMHNSELAEAKNLLESTTKQAENWVSSIQERVKAKKASIEGLRDKINKLEKPKLLSQEEIKKLYKKVHNLKKRIDERESIERELFKFEFKLENRVGDIENEISNQKKLKSQYTSVAKTCIACGQKIPAETIKKQKLEISEEIKSSRARIKKLELELSPIKEEIKRLKEKSEDIKYYTSKLTILNGKVAKLEDQQREVSEYDIKVKNLNELIAKVEEEILDIKKHKPSFGLPKLQSRVEKLLGKIAPLEKLQAKLNKRLEIISWLIKEPLSNSGIKAFIFDQMLALVNESLLKYSAHLGFSINFGIDMESAHKDFYISLEDGDNIRLYQDLSGGEQQLVNICIAFAIHDVICSDKGVNVLIMDEVFESLDPENIEIVSNLISLKGSDKSIHIITHHRDFNPVNANLIQLVKQKGKTTLVQ